MRAAAARPAARPAASSRAASGQWAVGSGRWAVGKAMAVVALGDPRPFGVDGWRLAALAGCLSRKLGASKIQIQSVMSAIAWQRAPFGRREMGSLSGSWESTGPLAQVHCCAMRFRSLPSPPPLPTPLPSLFPLPLAAAPSASFAGRPAPATRSQPPVAGECPPAEELLESLPLFPSAPPPSLNHVISHVSRLHHPLGTRTILHHGPFLRTPHLPSTRLQKGQVKA